MYIAIYTLFIHNLRIIRKMDVTTFLQAQSREYQRHASHTAELRATLEQQLNMEMYKTIPREYQPKQLKASKTSLTEEFTKEYNQLFFKHLEKVITSNQIELQLHTSALTRIIVQTEVHLSKSQLPSTEISSLYKKFLLDNHIEDRIAIPELQIKLQDESSAPITSIKPKKKRRQKRKCPSPAPEPSKHTKQDHFLFVGSQEIRTPP